MLTLVINLYLITNFFSTHATTELSTLILIRLVMFFAAPMSVLFFLFMHTFPRSTLLISRRAVTFWVVATALTMAVAISPFLFTGVEGIGSAGRPIPGAGMLLFIPVAIFTIPLGFYYLVKNNFRSTGINRVQLKYLLVGTSIMFMLIIGLIFIPVVFANNTRFVPLSATFTLPFVILTSYTIIRHRLMDIRAALFRGLSLSFLIGSVLAVYSVLLIVAVPLAADISGLRSDFIAAAAALISIPIARYIQIRLTKLTDKFLFQDKANYQEALITLSRKLSGTIDIDDVTETIMGAMKDYMRTKEVIIFLHDPQTGEYLSHGTSDGRKINFHLEPTHPS